MLFETERNKPWAVECYGKDGHYNAEMSFNAQMVSSGLAFTNKAYSKRYVNNEEEAKLSNKGMWQGTLIEP